MGKHVPADLAPVAHSDSAVRKRALGLCKYGPDVCCKILAMAGASLCKCFRRQSPCPCKQPLTLYHSVSHGHGSCLLKVSLGICPISFVFISLAGLDFSLLVVAVLTCSSSLADST